MPPHAASTHGTAAQHSLLLAITNVVDCCVLRCCHPSLWPTTTIIIIISILHLLASSFAPLLSCVPPPHSPIFHCGHRRCHRLRLNSSSNVLCLIVVCCRSSSLFVLVLSPFSSSRSSSALAPHSSAPTTLVYLIVACIRDGFDGRSFSSVDASQMFNWVIVIAEPSSPSSRSSRIRCPLCR